jgi:SAM-dependent methyltransferase
MIAPWDAVFRVSAYHFSATKSRGGSVPIVRVSLCGVRISRVVGVVCASQDAFGRALLDHHEGRPGPPLILERDDGSSGPAMQPEEFFLPPGAWPWWERHVLGLSAGAVLDLGAGAGRHSLHLQDLGHEVTAVDSSPGAVAVCRARGIRDVRLADLTTLRSGRRWETVLMMCGNLGLAGEWEPTRRLLKQLGSMTVAGGLLIGASVDPDDPEDLDYQERNRRAGLHQGRVRLRLGYGDLMTPWWELLNLPPGDIEALVDGTGWRLEEHVVEGADHVVVLRRRA